MSTPPQGRSKRASTFGDTALGAAEKSVAVQVRLRSPSVAASSSPVGIMDNDYGLKGTLERNDRLTIRERRSLQSSVKVVWTGSCASHTEHVDPRKDEGGDDTFTPPRSPCSISSPEHVDPRKDEKGDAIFTPPRSPCSISRWELSSILSRAPERTTQPHAYTQTLPERTPSATRRPIPSYLEQLDLGPAFVESSERSLDSIIAMMGGAAWPAKEVSKAAGSCVEVPQATPSPIRCSGGSDSVVLSGNKHTCHLRATNVAPSSSVQAAVTTPSTGSCDLSLLSNAQSLQSLARPTANLVGTVPSLQGSASSTTLATRRGNWRALRKCPSALSLGDHVAGRPGASGRFVSQGTLDGRWRHSMDVASKPAQGPAYWSGSRHDSPSAGSTESPASPTFSISQTSGFTDKRGGLGTHSAQWPCRFYHRSAVDLRAASSCPSAKLSNALPISRARMASLSSNGSLLREHIDVSPADADAFAKTSCSSPTISESESRSPDFRFQWSSTCSWARTSSGRASPTLPPVNPVGRIDYARSFLGPSSNNASLAGSTAEAHQEGRPAFARDGGAKEWLRTLPSRASCIAPQDKNACPLAWYRRSCATSANTSEYSIVDYPFTAERASKETSANEPQTGATRDVGSEGTKDGSQSGIRGLALFHRKKSATLSSGHGSSVSIGHALTTTLTPPHERHRKFSDLFRKRKPSLNPILPSATQDPATKQGAQAVKTGRGRSCTIAALSDLGRSIDLATSGQPRPSASSFPRATPQLCDPLASASPSPRSEDGIVKVSRKASWAIPSPSEDEEARWRAKINGRSLPVPPRRRKARVRVELDTTPMSGSEGGSDPTRPVSPLSSPQTNASAHDRQCSRKSDGAEQRMARLSEESSRKLPGEEGADRMERERGMDMDDILDPLADLGRLSAFL